MTTAAQLIKELQALPPETEVEVMKEVVEGWTNTTTFAPVSLNSLYVSDFTSEKWKNYPHVFGRRILMIEAE